MALAKKFGPWVGSIVALILAAMPYVNGSFAEYKEQSRQDAAQQQTFCSEALADLREEMVKMRDERKESQLEMRKLRDEVAELKTLIRVQRSADEASDLARWELDGDFRLVWFNDVFREQVLDAMGISPAEAMHKRWREILPLEVARKAETTDALVKSSRSSVSYDDGFTIERQAEGWFKVFFRVIKEPFLDGGRFTGLRGVADPYRQEPYTGPVPPPTSRDPPQ